MKGPHRACSYCSSSLDGEIGPRVMCRPPTGSGLARPVGEERLPSHSSVSPSQRQRSKPGPSVVRSLRIVLVGMVLALVPFFATASPPDPTWIGGIYDAADGDEIVTLIGDQAGSNGVAVYAVARPLQLSQALLQLERCTAQSISERCLTRGPPRGACTASPFIHFSHSSTSRCWSLLARLHFDRRLPAGGRNA
jgi:hypothetical protein